MQKGIAKCARTESLKIGTFTIMPFDVPVDQFD